MRDATTTTNLRIEEPKRGAEKHQQEIYRIVLEVTKFEEFSVEIVATFVPGCSTKIKRGK